MHLRQKLQFHWSEICFQNGRRHFGRSFATSEGYLTVGKWRYMTSLILVNIDNGNGLLPDDAKPLTLPMLTYFKFDSHKQTSVKFE